MLGRKRFVEAEPLLIEGYEGMKRREATIPPALKFRLDEALDRLIRCSEGLAKPSDTAKWKREREAHRASRF